MECDICKEEVWYWDFVVYDCCRKSMCRICVEHWLLMGRLSCPFCRGDILQVVSLLAQRDVIISRWSLVKRWFHRSLIRIFHARTRTRRRRRRTSIVARNAVSSVPMQ